MPVVSVDPRSQPGWDAYVQGHGLGCAYHLSAYAELLQRAYRFSPQYLAAVDAEGRLTGVMPIVLGTGLVTPRRLNSLSMVRLGGPLGDSREVELDLMRAACALIARTRARKLTVRSRALGLEEDIAGLDIDDATSGWCLSLPADPAALRESYRGGSKHLLRNLKKADKAPLTVRHTRARHDIRAFYGLYLRTMKRHGALPHSWREFRLAPDLLGDVYELVLVEHEGRLVAGGVFYVVGDEVELLYNASEDDARDLRPNHRLYWHVIEWAIGRGLRRFEFGGAVRGSSLAEFKQQWGAREGAVCQYVYAQGEAGSAVDALVGAHVDAQENRGALTKVWRALPWRATGLAGHVLYRWL